MGPPWVHPRTHERMHEEVSAWAWHQIGHLTEHITPGVLCMAWQPALRSQGKQCCSHDACLHTLSGG